MKVLCVGMMVCDVLLSPVPDNIMEQEVSIISKPVYACGGDALNVAFALKKLGVEVMVSGRIGMDSAGEFLLKECNLLKIETTNLIQDKQCPTAISFALIDKKGERHFLSENSIFSKLAFDDIDLISIQQSDYVYFGSAMMMSAMDNGGLVKLFKTAHDLGKITVLDAAINDKKGIKNWLEVLSPVLRETDFFFPSYGEAKLLSGKSDPQKISKLFDDFGMKAFGIKLGSDGCYVTDFINEKFIPGIKNVKVVDTTGAGDSFMAGFICALIHGNDIFEGAEFGNTIAALNIGSIGGAAGVPDFETARKFYLDKKQK